VSEPKVQRWECETNEFGDSDMQKNIIGNYVRYEDYARLKAEVERLTAECKNLERYRKGGEKDGLYDPLTALELVTNMHRDEKAEVTRLKSEVERWKEASENYRLMLQDRQAHLDAERKYVERLTKTGDVMADFISPNPTAEMWGEEQAIKQAWENAKEGKQS
jgi:hypothetical protein